MAHPVPSRQIWMLVNDITVVQGPRKQTHRAQVRHTQHRLATKAIVQRRHMAPHNQCDDSCVIQLISPLRHLPAVIQYNVKRRAHTQAEHCAAKEAREDEHVR